MKEDNSLYENYSDKKYAHFRNVKTGQYEVKKGKGNSERLMPIIEKRKIPFEEIKSFKLDTIGTLAPTLDTEDFTIVNNYLLDFWSACISSEAVQIYLHLKRYAYGKKDYCFPDIDIISMKMGKTRNTVKKYIEVLEKHHFVAMFGRCDITDNNRDVSPLFKIRRHIPLITEEMYESLPDKLKEKHDEFMAEYNDLALSNTLTETEAITRKMEQDKEIIGNKRYRDKLVKLVEDDKKKQYIVNRISDNSRVKDIRLHEYIENKVSKPSYETWFEGTIFVENDTKKWYAVCPNEFTLQWIQEKYLNDLITWFDEELDEEINPSEQLEFCLYDQMIRILN